MGALTRDMEIEKSGWLLVGPILYLNDAPT